MAISMKLKDAVTNLSKGSVLSHPLSSEYHSKSLLDSYNDYVFLWNEYDSSVVAVSQRDHEFEKVHLVPTDTPFFQVNQLSVSPSGKWIIISGKKGKNIKNYIKLNIPVLLNHNFHNSHMKFIIFIPTGVIAMEIPRRVGKRGRFLANSSSKPNDGYSEIVCRVIPIMDRLFSKHPRLVVNQVNISSYIDKYLLTIIIAMVFLRNDISILL